MSLTNNFKMLSLYNQRINNQLLDCCFSLPNELLVKETHSFFSNIISYWNHILFGDLIISGRLAKNQIAGLSLEDLAGFPIPKSPNDIYYHNLEAISELRKKVDRVIINYCENLVDTDCERKITYQTTEGKSFTKSVAELTQHLFNHQTHHRGQLTCILSQFGADYGCMDLPVIVPEGSQV
ncbi:DinB family protein [Aliikangiella coralliicola]|uniref:Damage-inducible protein DinB n=1 Tax=Aliikangiella coralliicola TaxID=2592383 RepID=A0A545UJ10_9GAMM|nr:DinB family protein [Aliikangiella coralliicola]TQV89451.1 damage-inducible protein DinB [Aliikangiella coralliicola]